MSDIKKRITKHISEINPAELACRILEGCAGVKRPEGATAVKALEHVDPETREGLYRAAENACQYIEECIMSEKSREVFELWIAGLTNRDDSGNYIFEVQTAWKAWEAARNIYEPKPIELCQLEKVAQAMLDVKAARPSSDGQEFPILSLDPDFYDLPFDNTGGTDEDEITQEAVLKIAKAALSAIGIKFKHEL